LAGRKACGERSGTVAGSPFVISYHQKVNGFKVSFKKKLSLAKSFQPVSPPKAFSLTVIALKLNH